MLPAQANNWPTKLLVRGHCGAPGSLLLPGPGAGSLRSIQTREDSIPYRRVEAEVFKFNGLSVHASARTARDCLKTLDSSVAKRT